jgi:hypothetical protein
MAQTSLPASCCFIRYLLKLKRPFKDLRIQTSISSIIQKLTGYFVKTASRLGHTVSADPPQLGVSFERERERAFRRARKGYDPMPPYRQNLVIRRPGSRSALREFVQKVVGHQSQAAVRHLQ